MSPSPMVLGMVVDIEAGLILESTLGQSGKGSSDASLVDRVTTGEADAVEMRRVRNERTTP